MVDWSKPIALANGEPVQLLETRPEGFAQFPNATRMIKRLNETNQYTAIWFLPEDGKSSWPEELGFYVVNVE